ncbi:MAG: hypothetical protein GY703_04775 [Gammaproteobacteria bacterium]|nr:hypothetical protein [Gammaproteobacteria bacterium]
MATKVTEGEREAFESRIAGADKVEIKITVARSDEGRAVDALAIERRDSARRDIYFFDTPELDLFNAGVVLRARAIEDDKDDSVAKIRPVKPGKVDKKWHDTEGFKIEADVVGEKVVMSASLKVGQKKDAIEKVVRGKSDTSELFSKQQKALVGAFAEGVIERKDIAILGPIHTLRADIERPGMAYRITTEYWTLPDGRQLLEMSIKCPPEEAVVAREVFAAFLAGHGLDPNGTQSTKTRLALVSLVEQLGEES